MSRLPWDPAEIGTHEADLDGVADRLTRHAEEVAGPPPTGLVARIHTAVEQEPLPVARWWQRLGTGAGWRAPARLMAAAAVLALGVIGGLALGELTGQQNSGSGSSPTPVVSPSPTRSATPSPSPSATPTVSPTPSASPVSSATLTTPPPTAAEEAETPDPDEDSGGNSGPGGGGDNSGPGGGG
jgi:hypothetical protein